MIHQLRIYEIEAVFRDIFDAGPTMEGRELALVEARWDRFVE